MTRPYARVYFYFTILCWDKYATRILGLCMNLDYMTDLEHNSGHGYVSAMSLASF